MKLYIKNMVCDRCKMAIQQALKENSLDFTQLELGEVELAKEPEEAQLQQFQNQIEQMGFELIEDRNARIISKIKHVVLTFVRGNSSGKRKLSVEISDALNKDYGSLSNLFSSVEGITIEQFAILQKIEFVKE